jgi:hypothetical protein
MADYIPRYDRKNVLRGMASLWVADYNALSPVTLPPDTMALGADWAAATNAIQSLTVGGSGLTTFTITHSGQTTSSIAAAATGATVQAALIALSNLAPGDVTVSGGSGGPWILTFAGVHEGLAVATVSTTPTGGSGTVTPAVVQVGGVGGGVWRAAGATESGVTMRFTRETTDITIEEQVNPVDVATNTLDPRIECTLSEDTLETMMLAYGGGSIDVIAAAVGQPGISELSIAEEVTHLTLAMEGVNNKGFFRRVLFDDVLSVAEVETSYRRAETQRLYAVSFRLVSPIANLKIREMTAVAL